MLEEGKISAKEAEDLISALETSEKPAAAGASPRWVRINVFDKSNEKHKVNANIPLSLARIAFKFIPGKLLEKMSREGIDLENVLKSVKEGVKDGKIVEIDNESEVISITLE